MPLRPRALIALRMAAGVLLAAGMLAVPALAQATTDLQIQHTSVQGDPGGQLVVGKEYEITLTVKNNGPDVGPDHPKDLHVVYNVSENLRVSLRNASFCALAGTTVTCDMSFGGNFNFVELPIYIWVMPTRAGAITNTATVSSSSPDPVLANNTSTLTATAVADQTSPLVSSASSSNSAFAPGGSGVGFSANGKQVPRGTKFLYTLSEAARVEITIEQRVKGRHSKGRCRAGRKKGKRCTTYQRRGRATVQGVAGRNSTPFNGKVRGRRLRVGRYRASIVAVDAAGNRSVARVVNFRIVKG